MDRRLEAVPESGVVGAGPDIPALYEKHKDAMYRVARSMLRGDADHRAEDIVQEAVISLWRTPPKDVESWEAVFIQTVKRKVYDLWKSSANQHEVLVLDDATPLDDELGGDDLGLDPAVVIEEIREREALVAVVRGAMAELARTDPEGAHAYRQVKELERTSQEVAAEMGVSDSRVRQHIMRARKRLMEILSASGGAL
ncbi:sigma-70 family RNA polymerase sigma factor [Terrabacter sp. MAHUQ-38]|uniref:sigma-70 family RNA polymerase sigma factor n=1 Tax=unclassified Terrabacter TaxID=2630222 RepID=UPI00165E3844|nr:sigma-70 family RNA polymerase sigma factor [Terrabacter sp. MAHUQ-38]MBC9820108.1 sigma-70 family RNA polymerase sigma factor [Terrabacter sp. MAHUQ-38]